MTTPLLEIKDLHAEVEGTPILKGVDLTMNQGECHSIMGPNGSGKSTLASILAGKDAYEVTQGQVLFQGQDLLEMEPDERALAGVFLAFQYPVEIPGVGNTQFLKAALNARRQAQGLEDIDSMEFIKLAREKCNLVNIDQNMLKRSVNEGFSGGEKKRFEIFQLALLEPMLAVLDETDSGLDIDALKVVADGVNKLRTEQRGFLVITHYQRLLNYIVPDHVHVLVDGQVVRSGDKNLALELEEKGYAGIAGAPTA
jgi:Fe-S cluster assembly ATP-binding protein